MQLPGDTQPLLHRPAGRSFLLGPFRFFGTCLDLTDMQLPHAEGHEHNAGGDKPARRVEPSPAAIGAHLLSLGAGRQRASSPGTHPGLLPQQYRGGPVRTG